MLIRKTKDGGHECVSQEQHALQSGVLAAAWKPTRLPPLLVMTIGLHDTPWRDADRQPLVDEATGMPHDFLNYPTAEKLALYRAGIDALEEVHPWVAYMVSRHYTTFAGTVNLAELQATETARRTRLEQLLPDELLASSDEALAWIKFFDVFSLHLCLTGPAADESAIPGWLRDSSKWSTAPDGTTLALEWRDDATLAVDPWPFHEDPNISLYVRRLGRVPGTISSQQVERTLALIGAD